MIEKPNLNNEYFMYIEDGKFNWKSDPIIENPRYTGKFIGEHADPSGGKIVDYISFGCGAVVLNDKGEIFKIGSNSRGQLGKNRRGMDIHNKAEPNMGHPRKGNRQLYTELEKISVPNDEKVKSIHTPYHYTMEESSRTTIILTEKGDVYCVGENVYGERGNGALSEPVSFEAPLNLPKIKRISSGNGCTIAQSEDDKFYGWGKNASGNLCIEQTGNITTPTEIPKYEHINKTVKMDVIPYGRASYLNNGRVILHKKIDRKDGHKNAIVVLSTDTDIESIHDTVFRGMRDMQLSYVAEYKNGTIGQLRTDTGMITPIKIFGKETALTPFPTDIGRAFATHYVTNKLAVMDNDGLPYVMDSDLNIEGPSTLELSKVFEKSAMQYPLEFIQGVMEAPCK